jgi:hypothetical protein
MKMTGKYKKGICLTNTTHEKLVQTRFPGQDVKKPTTITDCNFYDGRGGVDMSDAYLVSYHSTRKMLKSATRNSFFI